MKVIITIDETKLVGLDADYVRARILDAVSEATDYGAIEEYIWDEYDVDDKEAEHMAKSVEKSVEVEIKND